MRYSGIGGQAVMEGVISERLSFWITLKTQPFLSYRESREHEGRSDSGMTL